MGEPQETRHLVLQNNAGNHFSSLVNSCWLWYCNLGTIWGMAGESYTYTDMDVVAIPDIR